MIKLNRDDNPPRVIFKIGVVKNIEKWVVSTETTIGDYESDSRPFENGKYKFNKAFGVDEFRERLIILQDGKCGYCEKKIDKGDIEHYRPKAAVITEEVNGNYIQPGYYWLAYSWWNMLLACSDCNSQEFKGNKFPLVGGEINRCKDHNENINLESPVLIDPINEVAEKLIEYNNETAIPIKRNVRAQRTIDILGLNTRTSLVEDRREKLASYRMNKIVANLPRGIITSAERAEANNFLTNATSRRSKFSNMINSNIKAARI